MQHVRRNLTGVGLAVAVAVMTTSVVQAGEKQDIVETAVAAGSFKTLAAALEAGDLVDVLKGDGPFTVFAPTDAAFAKLPKGTIANLLKPENKESLVNILTYHVVSGRVPAKQVVKLSGANTVNGQRVEIKVADGKVEVDGAQVVATDIECSNGIIHVIDRVILPSSDNIPSTAANAKIFNTLLAAVKSAGLAKALSGKGPFTVFAPTDEAFAKLPKGTVESLLKPENKSKLVNILKYHVVSGRIYSDAALSAGTAKTLQGGSLKITSDKDGAKVNEASLIKLDIDAVNGVIHVIDRVMLPQARRNVGANDAKKMIEVAVAHGVSLYNRGHHAACARVYEQTARQLVKHGDDLMPPLAMQNLSSALAKTQHTQCATTNSWTLRRGLDNVYRNLRMADRR